MSQQHQTCHNSSERARPSRSGSALLLTLLVVSLLLVLVLSLTVYVRLELREIENRQALAHARSNAKVALQLAIATLQKSAGPDTRITATADLHGSTAQPYWTGVWPSNTSEAPWDGIVAGNPQWLVSGNETANPDTPLPNGGKVRIFPEDTGLSDAENVVVPVQEFTQAGKSSRYAWWIGDEGVKARIDLKSDTEPDSDLERELLSQSPQAPALSRLNTTWTADSVWTDADQIQKLSTGDTLQLQAPNLSPLQLRHELTTYSQGLPVNVKDGGLKTDWSMVLDRSMEGSSLVDYALGARASLAETVNGVPVYTYSNGQITDPDWFFLSGNISNTPYTTNRPGPNLGILWQYGRLWQMRSASGTLAKNVTAQPAANTPVKSTQWLPYQNDGDNQHVNSPVAPVLSHLRFGMRLTARQKGNSAGTPTYALWMEYKPLIGLWNPYNVGLDANNYSMDWYVSPYVKIRITNSLTNEVTEHTAWAKRQWPGKANPSQPGGQYLRLRVNDADFEPGEVRLFSVDEAINNKVGFQVAKKFIFLESAWGEEGVVLAEFDQSTSGGYVKEPLEGVPQGSSIKVVEVGIHDSYHDETHTHWTYTEDGSSTWIYLKTNDNNDGTDYLESYDGERIAGFSDFWNSGPVDEVPPSSVDPVPEKIHHTADLPADTTPEAIVASPLHLATWAFHLRTGKDIGDADQRIRGWIDTNPRALGSNAAWEGDGEFDHVEGWDYLSSWTGEGTGNRGFAYDESPRADPNRYRGYLGNTSEAGNSHLPIFDIPTGPLTSVGQFQHAHLARYDFEPAFVAGNSYASLRIPLDRTVAENYNGISGFDLSDISYDVNQRIWDEMFFSTLAPDYLGGGNDWDAALSSHLDSLPNPRMRYVTDESAGLNSLISSAGDRAAEAIAARIRINGGFNINSTSKTAWMALLSSLGDNELPVLNPETGSLSWESPQALRFNRFSQVLQAAPYETGDAYDPYEFPSADGAYWKGWRKISPAELEVLAETIVKEVKARGPFRSLSEFVNRNPAATSVDHQRKGALQAALDQTINLPGTALNNDLGDLASPPPGSRFSNAIDGESSTAGAAGYVLQGDLLQSLAPVLQARSDTFRIRAYAETGNGIKSWCEAILQRDAQYLDPSNQAWENDKQETLSPVNQTFGRRFKIVSFRWLSPVECGEVL